MTITLDTTPIAPLPGATIAAVVFMNAIGVHFGLQRLKQTRMLSTDEREDLRADVRSLRILQLSSSFKVPDTVYIEHEITR